MLVEELMSSSRNEIVVGPPSWVRALARLRSGSEVRVSTAEAPREGERAVR